MLKSREFTVRRFCRAKVWSCFYAVELVSTNSKYLYSSSKKQYLEKLKINGQVLQGPYHIDQSHWSEVEYWISGCLRDFKLIGGSPDLYPFTQRLALNSGLATRKYIVTPRSIEFNLVKRRHSSRVGCTGVRCRPHWGQQQVALGLGQVAPRLGQVAPGLGQFAPGLGQVALGYKVRVRERVRLDNSLITKHENLRLVVRDECPVCLTRFVAGTPVSNAHRTYVIYCTAYVCNHLL